MAVVTTGKALILIIIALFLRAGSDIVWLMRTGNAVAVVIGIFVPENDGKARGGCSPACLKRSILRRHGCGKRRIPAVEFIAGLFGFSNADGRAVAGIYRLYAVAAVQIELHQIVVTVVVDLDHCAAVCCDLSRCIVKQSVEAVVVLSEVCAYGRLGIAGLGLGIDKSIVVVIDILLIVLDRELNFCGLISNGNSRIFNIRRSVNTNGLLVRLIADYIGAFNVLNKAFALNNGGRPRVGSLSTVCEDIIYRNNDSFFNLAFESGRYSFAALGGCFCGCSGFCSCGIINS